MCTTVHGRKKGIGIDDETNCLKRLSHLRQHVLPEFYNNNEYHRKCDSIRTNFMLLALILEWVNICLLLNLKVETLKHYSSEAICIQYHFF